MTKPLACMLMVMSVQSAVSLLAALGARAEWGGDKTVKWSLSWRTLPTLMEALTVFFFLPLSSAWHVFFERFRRASTAPRFFAHSYLIFN